MFFNNRNRWSWLWILTERIGISLCFFRFRSFIRSRSSFLQYYSICLFIISTIQRPFSWFIFMWTQCMLILLKHIDKCNTVFNFLVVVVCIEQNINVNWRVQGYRFVVCSLLCLCCVNEEVAIYMWVLFVCVCDSCCCHFFPFFVFEDTSL